MPSSTLRVANSSKRRTAWAAAATNSANRTAPNVLTCTIVGWLPVFTRPETVQIIFDSWKFLHDNDRMSILGFVILENHLHFIGVSPHLSKEVGDFKSFTARKIIDQLKAWKADTILDQLRYHKVRHKSDRQFQLWQEGSHPQEIHDEAMLRQKLEYIHYNPVRRGYVDKPEHWRYSSARNYMGLERLVPIVTDWA